MRNINWYVTFWLRCENRLGEQEAERVEKQIYAYAQSHRPELSTFQLHKMLHKIDNKKWPNWYLYCYFIVNPQPIVDVVDVVPIQNTKEGEKWLQCVDKHFEVFGMPWRTRQPEYTYHMMISGGQRAVESLRKSVAVYIKGLKVKSDTRKRFLAELKDAGKWLDGYYTAMNKEDHRQALVALDTAVYILHDLIFDAGEELGFIPVRAF